MAGNALGVTMVRIGVLKLGGIGDMCDLCVLIDGIRRKHPGASISAIVNCGAMRKILSHYADAVMVDTKRDWHTITRSEGWKYDLFYDMRPHRCVVLAGNMYTKLLRFTEHYPLSYIRRWYHYNSWYTNKLQKLGKTVIELNAESADIIADYDMSRYPVELIPDAQEWITINTGAMGSERGLKQTKQWDYKKWQRVVDKLLHSGETVVQVGKRWEKKLRHCHHIWNANLGTIARYLASSKLHLGVENGIVRLRRLVTDKPSVVLFGPTHPKMYGFSNNVNIFKNICYPCLWYTGNWMWKCAMGWDNICMKNITPELVLDEIWTILQKA